ncbi:MAG: ankyrin repeat domain-containing protein [Legionellales bacterium]|jgi:ankyrin repeat protein
MIAKNIHSAVRFLEVDSLNNFLAQNPKGVNELNEWQSTVLHSLAAFAPAPERVQRFNQIAKILMSYDADPFIKDKHGRTALDFAIELNLYPPYIKLLQDYMAKYAADHAITNTSATSSSVTPALHQRRGTSTASSSVAATSSTTTTYSNSNSDTDNSLQNLIQTMQTFTS